MRAATEARDKKRLDHWLNMCAELPWGGSHTEQVKGARALMPRLQEEERVLAMLRSAMEARDPNELSAALEKVDRMVPPITEFIECGEEIEKAKALAKLLQEERELKSKLREATASRNADALATLLAQADGLPLNDCDELNHTCTEGTP